MPLVLCVAGCKDSELNALYGDCLVVGRNDGKHVEASCTNSPFAERPDRERAITARKVAEYVRDHYVSYQDARDVTVTFWSKKETAKGDIRHPRARYTFTRAELGEPPTPLKQKPDRAASAPNSTAPN
ncbi:MAG TPA: hypothetical protein VFJ82_09745 [Longimicrobium sp.]|nr:hypothetical protein [Longimicrobium sp.]